MHFFSFICRHRIQDYIQLLLVKFILPVKPSNCNLSSKDLQGHTSNKHFHNMCDDTVTSFLVPPGEYFDGCCLQYHMYTYRYNDISSLLDIVDTSKMNMQVLVRN